MYAVFIPTNSSNVLKPLLEVAWKNTGHSIKLLKYFNAADKDNVFPLYGMKIH